MNQDTPSFWWLSVLLLSVIILVGLSACAGDPSSVSLVAPDCTLPGPTVSPPSATLHVGDTLHATAAITICEGVPTSRVFHWRSSDTVNASVDSITGLVRARHPGTASIIATLVVNPAIRGAMA